MDGKRYVRTLGYRFYFYKISLSSVCNNLRAGPRARTRMLILILRNLKDQSIGSIFRTFEAERLLQFEVARHLMLLLSLSSVSLTKGE